jgi:berberine-like enzyme
VGWLARKYGLAADSVIRAEVVTADGRTVTATAEHHSDLFWAIRGGTGNFGVVTSLEFRLYPVRQVHAGIVYYGIDRAAAILRTYREWTATIPNELSTAVVLTRIPGTEQRAVAIKVMYAGAPDLAEHLLKPLFEVAGQRLAGELQTIEYADAAMGGTPARHLDFLDTLTDEAIDIVTELEDATVEVRHWGGAMANPGPGAGPVGHRQAAYSLIIDREVAGLPSSGRTFVNFLGDPGRADTAYDARDLHRLREVKRAYDPANFFHLNANIRP